MNGAVQGEATAAASTPVRKESRVGSRARSEAMLDGSSDPNSNTPARLRPMSVNSAASAATIAGRLQLEAPAQLLRRRRAPRSAGRPARERRAPRPRCRPARCVQRSRGLPACCVSASTLSDNTGNTQGMRLRITPPNKANSSAVEEARLVQRCAPRRCLATRCRRGAALADAVRSRPC